MTGVQTCALPISKSKQLPTQTFNKRNDELKKTYLKKWIEEGARVSNLLSDSPASAQALVNVVLQGVEKH